MGINKWAYVPFDVPSGVQRIDVTTPHDRFSLIGVARNVLDRGIFGPAGHELGNAEGFRGWSGGARTGFTLSATDATPGYLAGPNDSGRWALALGTVALNPIGMDWQATIELPHAIAAVTAWALIVASGDAGRTAEAASVAHAGYANGIRGFDAAHMRFVIADGHVGASCCPGRVGAAGDTAERMCQQAAHLPGSAH